MKRNKWEYMRELLFPCLLLSITTGAVTGIVICLFKLSTSYVIKLSLIIYSSVRGNPLFLPLLVLGASTVGLISALILKYNKNSRGGGIPTSVAILRGLINFKWAKCLLGLFFSSLLTFFGGVPLGTEGPSVQMGTAIGRGTVELSGKKNRGWDRYIMTGGACGGFAVATGAPLSGIIFAFEEVHRRFSPLLFMTVAISVSVAEAVMHLLSVLTGVSPYLFEINPVASLPLNYLWIAMLIGVVCGIVVIAFTHLYSAVGDFVKKTLKTIPFTVKMVLTFAIVGVLGFASNELIGSGHELIQLLMEGYGVWYILLICFCVRAIILMFANHIGVSGGIFVPTLTFGAIIGALFSQLMTWVGILPKEYFIVPVIIGMAAFLAAASRIPITATAFSIEALGGITNSLPIIVGVTLAFLIIEIWGIPSLQDMVISEKTLIYNEGKTSTTVDEYVRVMPNSFAHGKEVKNILWPPLCTVISIKKSQKNDTYHGSGLIEAGDVLLLHYQTYDIDATHKALDAIVGTQPSENGISDCN